MTKGVAGSRSILVWLYCAVLALIGIGLLIGGARLLSLGGSPYYALAGLLVAASGVQTWRRHPSGPWLYGLMLALTVAWSIWEAGFDGWALAARLIAPFVLGLGFLLPGVRPAVAAPNRRFAGWPGLAAAFVIAVVVGSIGLAIGPHDPKNPIYQTGQQAAAPQPGAFTGADAGGADWLNYGADQGGSRYSALNQITPDNVGKLKVAWTADLGPGPNGTLTQLEVTPLKIGRSVYICTASSDVLSLDAETGKINWRFKSGNKMKDAEHAACRGVAYYRVPAATGPCAERIITNTTDARLIALDTATGARCAGFGQNGETDLTTGMGKVSAGYYYVSSAPTMAHLRRSTSWRTSTATTSRTSWASSPRVRTASPGR